MRANFTLECCRPLGWQLLPGLDPMSRSAYHPPTAWYFTLNSFPERSCAWMKREFPLTSEV